jgi:peptide/nickel transport system permease protein
MRWSTKVFLAVVAFWFAIALLAPYCDIPSSRVDLGKMFAPPTTGAWFGYDDLGRNIMWRLVDGATISCLVAVTVVGISTLVGTAVGVFIGWHGGLIDVVGVRVLDVFLAFPGILLAIALAAVLGPGIGNTVLALVTVGWVGFARLARAQTLSLKHRDHVQVAAALGTSSLRTCLRHVLPLILAPLIVEATFGVAAVIIAEAGLSFLGVGVQPPTPSWGSMIKQGTQYLLIAPHIVAGPGFALFLVVMTVNVLGDRLRDHLHIR